MNGPTLGFQPEFPSPPKKKNENNLKQRNKHYHTKLLLNSFHLNGHPLGFLIKTQESGTALYIRINTTPENYCSAAKGKLQNDLRCDFECAFFFLDKDAGNYRLGYGLMLITFDLFSH